MLRGLVTAVRTLSIMPIPGRDADNMASSLPWFPIVGGILGVLLYGFCLLAELVGLNTGLTVWPEGVAFLVVAMGAILTRGIHLDGLADWADGFASITKKERTLEIMKDSRVGTFGVLALIAVFFAKWIAVTRMVGNGSTLWLIAAYVVSRTIQVELAYSLPYARASGGTGASFVNGALLRHRLGAWLIAVALLAAIGPYGPVALVPGIAAALVLWYWFRRRLGGVTGDLLGASSEIVETLLLLLVAMQ